MDPALIAHLAPRGLEPDTRDGRAFASLVAFDFLDTRVLGVRILGHADFPEVNLRSYVVEPGSGRRGVFFVRELVPRRAIVWVARTIYNEPYSHARMSSRVARTDASLEVRHEWTVDKRASSLMIRADVGAAVPDERSEAHFFKEHQWGFGRDRRGRTLMYEVHHPVWATHVVRETAINVDFGTLYGSEWAPLTNAAPHSVMLAAGSAVQVHNAKKLA